LLENGADATIQNVRRESAAHKGIYYGEVMDRLAERESVLNIQNDDGNAILLRGINVIWQTSKSLLKEQRRIYTTAIDEIAKNPRSDYFYYSEKRRTYVDRATWAGERSRLI
jgi:hypothetical protein